MPLDTTRDDNTSPVEATAGAGPDGHKSARPTGLAVPLSWARMTWFAWMDPLMALGSERPLELDDMPMLQPATSAVIQGDLLGVELQRQLCRFPGRPVRAVLTALLRLHRFAALMSMVGKLGWDLAQFMQPAVLFCIILWLQAPPDAWYAGYDVAVALILAMFLSIAFLGFTQASYEAWVLRTGGRVRLGLAALVFRKALRLPQASRDATSSGSLINMVGLDTIRIELFVALSPWLISGPLLILAILISLWFLLGPAILAAVVVIIALIPLQYYVASRMEVHMKAMLECTDKRVKLTNEILTGIRAIKSYAWERSFLSLIDSVRDEETGFLWRWAQLKSFHSFFFNALPILIAASVFTVHIAIGGSLKPEIIFASLALMNVLRMPLAIIPMTLTLLLQSRVSIRRIAELLAQPDLPLRHDARDTYPVGSIIMSNASFRWSAAAGDADAVQPAVLEKISLHLKPGSLTMVVGAVGAGKSSLLAAMMAELHASAYNTAAPCVSASAGSVAYVSQTAWVINASLRDNILFGNPLDLARYHRVLKACALLPDLKVLPAGDMTEIGEKGINLSGGQKQRVVLARAAYAQADIVLMDDSLSAVDAHVGRHLIKLCIGGEMQGRTRVLATNQVQYLRRADHVIVLENGAIRAQGTYDDIVALGINVSRLTERTSAELSRAVSEAVSPIALSREETPREAETPAAAVAAESARAAAATATAVVASAAAILQAGETQDNAGDRGDGDSNGSSAMDVDARVDDSVVVNAQQLGDPDAGGDNGAQVIDTTGYKGDEAGAGELIQLEHRETGLLGSHVLASYLNAMGSRVVVVLALLSFMVSDATRVAADSVLASWSAAAAAPGATTTATADLTAALLPVYVALGLTGVAFILVRSMSAMALGVRASKQLHRSLFNTVLRAPVAFFDVTPIGRILNRFSADLDAVDVKLPETMMNWTETLFILGAATLVVTVVSRGMFLVLVIAIAAAFTRVSRYYRRTSREIQRLDSVSASPIFAHLQQTLGGVDSVRGYGVQERFTRESDAFMDANARAHLNQWYSVVWLSLRMNLLAIVLVTGTVASVILLRVLVTSLPDASVAALGGLAITYAMNVTITMMWNVRMQADTEHWLTSVERIREYTVDTVVEAAPVIAEHRPSPGWPNKGAIRVTDLTLRYRPELDPVLHGISLDIKPGEKVGVVGRTGAGKSSLMQALLRLVEASAGSIEIDGVDVASIGLDDLRSNLSIIPQDPVIFSGTLRFNLDPFSQHSDQRLWQVLERAHLHKMVQRLPQQLDAVVSEGGSNFSQGERQLLSIARALLRDSKVLLLDEATSSIDTETDAVIQATFRADFAHCTVLTIAHRLDTIMDSDRVLVMAAGQVAEFDTPRALLQRADSVFSSLINETGEDNALRLRAAVEQAEQAASE